MEKCISIISSNLQCIGLRNYVSMYLCSLQCMSLVSASATLQCKRSLLHNKVEQHISDDVTIATMFNVSLMIDNVQWYIRLNNNIVVHVSKYTHTHTHEICTICFRNLQGRIEIYFLLEYLSELK